MTDDEKNDGLVCARCSGQVQSDDEFCTHCGSILIDNVTCAAHPEREAEGVCLICCVPSCKRCGAFLHDIFLCDAHAGYEMFEGMVRIYGDLNDTPAQHAKTCLEQAGFHPMIFCRTQAKGGPRIVLTLYRAAGEYDGNIVNEIKVMVPCQEVLEAEQVLRDLGILETNEAAGPIQR